jgi:hypothetical protein
MCGFDDAHRAIIRSQAEEADLDVSPLVELAWTARLFEPARKLGSAPAK